MNLFGGGDDLFYSGVRNEKETDRRAHHLAGDSGDGEKIGGIRKTSAG